MARVNLVWIEILILGTQVPLETFFPLVKYFSQFKRTITSYQTLPKSITHKTLQRDNLYNDHTKKDA